MNLEDPRAVLTDAKLRSALADMIALRGLKPELRARHDAGRNIFTRELLALQADVDRGTLSLHPERHEEVLRSLAEARKAAKARTPEAVAAADKAYNWRRRAQAAVSVSAGLMVEMWALQARLAREEKGPQDDTGVPTRLKGRRGERRGQHRGASPGG